jgi:hypothetical protein
MQQRALPDSPDILAAEFDGLVDGLVDGTRAACIRLGDRGGYPARSCLATSCTKPASIAADHWIDRQAGGWAQTRVSLPQNERAKLGETRKHGSAIAQAADRRE